VISKKMKGRKGILREGMDNLKEMVVYLLRKGSMCKMKNNSVKLEN
jgi:hypothetical protein